jgi:transposase-like protein
MAKYFDDEDTRAEYYEHVDRGDEQARFDENFSENEQDEREDFESQAKTWEDERDNREEYDDSDSGDPDLWLRIETHGKLLHQYGKVLKQTVKVEIIERCPFCKNDEHIVDSISSYVKDKQTGKFSFKCNKCKATGPEGINKVKAVELWNKRSYRYENANCPFCGSDDITTEILLIFNNLFAIICKNCWAVGPLCETQDDAFYKWINGL